jgi:archaemetzincin
MVPGHSTVDLIPIYLAHERERMDHLARRLESALRTRVRIRNPSFDPEAAFDLARGQYNSRVMLKLLLEDPVVEAPKVIGVTSVDLFAPVLSYVFGEAQLDGRVAVVSYHRLRPEAYGLPVDEALVRRRLETEAVHELGHTFGLLHCRTSACVMHASTYVEEIDLKTPEFCADCTRLLREAEPAGRAV